MVSQVRAEASRLLNALPANAPVLLQGAEADAAPILPYTGARSALRSAISEPENVEPPLPIFPAPWKRVEPLF